MDPTIQEEEEEKCFKNSNQVGDDFQTEDEQWWHLRDGNDDDDGILPGSTANRVEKEENDCIHAEPAGNAANVTNTVNTATASTAQNKPSSSTTTTTTATTTSNAANSSSSAPQFHFSALKAGMTQESHARLQKVLESQKNSAYYKQFEKADARVREKALELKRRATALTRRDLSIAEHYVGKAIEEQSRNCVLNGIKVVIDMDQFFAAVEIRDNPSLIGKPVAVGTTLVSTASYAARTYGVRSAMPTFLARQLCPELIVIPTNFEKYKKAAEQARLVFERYDQNFSSHSVDEAVLDLSERMEGLDLRTEEGCRRAEAIVQQLREDVSQTTDGLTCSAGIAPNRMLAKVASDRNKPNGQFLVSAQEAVSFCRSLKVRKIPGIGKAQELLLEEAFGIHTVQDLWDNRFVLQRTLTPVQFNFYLAVALGGSRSSDWSSFGNGEEVNRRQGRLQPLNPTTISSSGAVSSSSASNSNSASRRDIGDGEEHGEGRKSISTERTFRATDDFKALCEVLLHVCETLAERIRTTGIWGHIITLKYKSSEFEVRSRSVTRSTFIGGCNCTGRDLYAELEPELRAVLPASLRLIGVRLSGLEENLTAVTGDLGVAEAEDRISGRAGVNANGGSSGVGAKGDLDPGKKSRQPHIESFLGKSTKGANSSSCSAVSLLDLTSSTSHGKSSLPETKADMASPNTTTISPSAPTTQNEICPICNRTLKVQNNAELNQHIDACLNHDIVRSMVTSSQNTSSHSTTSTITDGQNAWIHGAKPEKRLRSVN